MRMINPIKANVYHYRREVKIGDETVVSTFALPIGVAPQVHSFTVSAHQKIAVKDAQAMLEHNRRVIQIVESERPS